MKKKSAITVAAILMASLGVQTSVYASNILSSGYGEEPGFQEEISEPVIEEETDISAKDMEEIVDDVILSEGSKSANDFGDRQHAEEVKNGQIYEGCTTEEAPAHWYKFVPELTREYKFCFSFDQSLVLYCDGYVEEDGDLHSTCSWEDVSCIYAELNAGNVYYFCIKFYDYWEENIVPGNVTLEVTKKREIDDYIQEQIEKYGPLKQLEEADNLGEKVYTKLYVDVNEDENYYVKFVPKYTRRYQFESDQFGPAGGIWDSSCNLVEGSSDLEKGKVYYIRAAYGKDESYDLDLSVVCVPRAISFKILEAPEPNILYIGCDRGRGSLYFPKGIVFEIEYENGMKEIPTHGDYFYGDYQVMSTSFGEHISNSIEGVKVGDYHTVKAGNYSMTFQLGISGLETRLDNIILKEMNQLPLIKNNGSLSVQTNFGSHAWIRFKADKTGKYKISGSCGQKMSLYVYEEGKTDESGFPNVCLLKGSSGDQVALKGGKYYYVEFSPNIINGIKQEEDEVTITIEPTKSEISKCKISMPSSVAYTGKKVVPTIKITDGTVILKKDSDYTIVYSNNKNLGTATAIIKGRGSYTGTVKKTFQIVPAVPSGFSVQQNGKQLKLQWKRAGGAKYYEVYQYKSGEWKKVKTTSAASYTDKSVKKGVTYKYKVRAYTVVNGKKFYGKFTSVKSYKLK